MSYVAATSVATDGHLGPRLKHLFDAVLRYGPDREPLDSSDAAERGPYIGSGIGETTSVVEGTITWSMYARECAYLTVKAGQAVSPGRHLCRASPLARIEPADGAVIEFNARGFGLRGYDDEQPHLWRLSMALRLTSSDQRYVWLNDTLALWEGNFDESSKTAKYSAFVQDAV